MTTEVTQHPDGLERSGQGLALFPRSAREWGWFAAKAALSLAVLVVAVMQVNLGAIFSSPIRIDYRVLSAGVLLLAASILTAAFRWSFLTRAVAPVGFRETTAITFAAQFVGQILPSSLGQDAVRAWLAIRGNRSAADTVSVILLDRLCGLIGLSALIFVGLPRLAALGGVAHGQQAAMVAGGFAAGAAISALVVRLIPTPEGLPALLTKIWDAARNAAKMLTSVTGLIAVTASVAVQALVTLSCWVIARSIGAELSLLDGFATIPAAMFVALLPISMNGWGVREGAMVVTLGFAGVSGSHAFLVSILFGMSLLVTSLPGAWALISLRRRP